MFSLDYAVASSVYPEQQSINRKQRDGHKTKPCGERIVFLRTVDLALFLHNCVVTNLTYHIKAGFWGL